MKKTVDKILQRLKRGGDATAKQLADELSMTTMGVRQHLQSLADDALIEFYDERAKVGRPSRHWRLTTRGHQHFADRHGDLAVQLLDVVEETLGEAALQQVIAVREAQSLAHYQHALSDANSSEEKLKILATLREQEGYMAELKAIAPQQYLLIENHCPICRAAQQSPVLCQSELTIFQTLLGPHCQVSRTEHIVAGQRRCAYQVIIHH